MTVDRSTVAAVARVVFAVVLLVTAIAVIVPLAPHMPTDGLDPSWVFGMNAAVAQGMAFGRDIVFTFDPWAPYEGHQDHRAVSWAAMEAASFAHFPLYHPEQLAGGLPEPPPSGGWSAYRPPEWSGDLEPWVVREGYYFAKSPRDVNKHVDISGDFIAKKIEALFCFDSQMVLTLREAQLQIEAAPYDIPAITSLDPHDYRGYMERTVRATAASIGRKYGVEYAEHFRRTRWGGTERLLGETVEDAF